MAIMTNGGESYRLIDEVVSRVQAVVLGRAPEGESLPDQPSKILDTRPYVGTYGGQSLKWTVDTEPEGLVLTATDTGASAVSSTVRLRHLNGHSFASVEPDCGMYPRFAFVMGRDGHAAFLHNGRAYPRQRQ